MPVPTLTRLSKWIDSRLHSASSLIHGRGLFTRSRIDAGEVLMTWGGILIELGEYDPERHRPSSTTFYDDTRYLTTPVGEPALPDEVMNHSCDPNLWMGDEVTVVARRVIAIGEELTMDYACWSDEAHVFTRSCRCQTSLCRGLITGFDWRIHALQSRYQGHLVPFLNRRIELQRTGEHRIALHGPERVADATQKHPRDAATEPLPRLDASTGPSWR